MLWASFTTSCAYRPQTRALVNSKKAPGLNYSDRSLILTYKALNAAYYSLVYKEPSVNSSFSRGLHTMNCRICGEFAIVSIGLLQPWIEYIFNLSAIEAAMAYFGPYFVTCNDSFEVVTEDILHDAIYYVGTIGCVEAPGDLTRNLLKRLKLGGMLIFNAPNRVVCDQLTACRTKVLSQAFWQTVTGLAETPDRSFSR